MPKFWHCGLGNPQDQKTFLPPATLKNVGGYFWINLTQIQVGFQTQIRVGFKVKSQNTKRGRFCASFSLCKIQDYAMINYKKQKVSKLEIQF